MSESNSNNCMFIGLPFSGKSSFIGAFWHTLKANNENSNYTIQTQPSDREYLNQLETNFLNCTPPERTKVGFEQQINLTMIDRSTNQAINFIFPDLSGETYEGQFEYRKLGNEYLAQLKETNSLILFINPDKLRIPNLITDANSILSELGLDGSENNLETENKTLPIEEIKWTPRMAQTQVILVDLLQMISPYLQKSCKLGIVISAWDVIKQDTQPIIPADWLKNKLPLLHQFLQSNTKEFTTQFFGVSAQGGKYSPESIKELQIHFNPIDRIKVQLDSDVSNDITIPLRWLFN